MDSRQQRAISSTRFPAAARLCSYALVATIAWSVFAFAGVYPWAWRPIIFAAIAIGVVGLLTGRRMSAGLSMVLVCWAVTAIAIFLQLVPVGRAVLGAVSPTAVQLLSEHLIGFDMVPRHALSIEPGLTAISLLFVATWALLLVGLDRLLTSTLIERLTRATLVIGIIVSVVGIAQRSNLTNEIYGFWQPFNGTLNAFGPFINRNHFAGWTVMACGLGLGYLFGLLGDDPPPREWRARLLWLGRPSGTEIVLVTFALAIMMVATVWSLSRSGIICLVVVVGALLTMGGGERRHLHSARRTTLLIVAFLFGAVMWRGMSVLAEKFATPDSVVTRLAAWKDTWAIVQDFPLVGTGMNTFTVAMLYYQRSNEGFHLAEAHNDYLQLLSDGGMLVLIPGVITLLAIARLVWRRWQQRTGHRRTILIQQGAAIGLLGIALQELVEFSLQKPANALLFVMLLAIAIYEPARAWPSLANEKGR